MFLTTTAVEMTSSPSSPITVPMPGERIPRLGEGRGVLSFVNGSVCAVHCFSR